MGGRLTLPTWLAVALVRRSTRLALRTEVMGMVEMEGMGVVGTVAAGMGVEATAVAVINLARSEEHTSELQSPC